MKNWVKSYEGKWINLNLCRSLCITEEFYKSGIYVVANFKDGIQPHDTEIIDKFNSQKEAEIFLYNLITQRSN